MSRLRISAFWQAVLVMVGAYLLFDNLFLILNWLTGEDWPTLMPSSLMIQYMVITALSVLLFFAFDDRRWNEFKAPIIATLREEKRAPLRWLLLVLVPGLAGYALHTEMRPSLEAPLELRQMHPSPPATINAYGKRFELDKLQNPVRVQILADLQTDEEAAWQRYQAAVESGRDVYYRNCFYCHGDLLDGQGHFAAGMGPQPVSFQDPTLIPQLQESYLFWRIVQGGPGLPPEGAPWNSTMPAWHQMLDEEAVWNVILFMFDYTEQVPRIWEREDSRQVTRMRDVVQARRAKLEGEGLYRLRCEVCHGEKGRGDGIAADLMYPRPRDFSLALFKYKSSPGSLLPRDEDLFQAIKFGQPGTAMPGWGSLLSDHQIRSLIPVIKGFDFTAAWAPEGADDARFDEDGLYQGTDFRVIEAREPLEGRVAYDEASVARGEAAYDKACSECHGKAGRGNILSGKRLEDDWGDRIWPRDLTKPWTWRSLPLSATGKPTREQLIDRIYTLISIGVPGTPMPAHRAVESGNEDPVSLDDRWHIANYVYSLLEPAPVTPGGSTVLGKRVEQSLPIRGDDPLWQQAPAVTLRLFPNIIAEDRLFTTLSDALTVRVLYNASEIGFLLQLNDRTESRPGIDYFSELQDERLTMFPDAFAIQFPADRAFSITPGVEKPLNSHGDRRHETTIWYWNAGSVTPDREASAGLIEGRGERSLTPREGDDSLQVSGEWSQGQWRVVMKRPRQPDNGDVSFQQGRYLPVSFASWDGSNGEIGSKHNLSGWYWLFLPQEEDRLLLYGVPLLVALSLFLLGWWSVTLLRRTD